MALQKYISCDVPSLRMRPLCLPNRVLEKAQNGVSDRQPSAHVDVDVDLREVYFLIMHFLSAGPCQRTYGQLWNELLQHQLLPRRYHAWYSRNGLRSDDENDDGFSFPLNYNNLAERYPHVGKDHLVNLLKELMVNSVNSSQGRIGGGHASSAADVPTLIGTGSFSLLERGINKGEREVTAPALYMRWPHMKADQLHGLVLREIGGGFSRHHRAPSIRAACYAIVKPSTLVQKMQNIKKLRGHRNAVYCAIFDRSGRYVVTGSDDRLVKIWSMETAYCLASCRGHEGDITDLAVNYINSMVASSSNDCIIRVWHLPDGKPISVLRGHTGAVSAIQFSPRPSAAYQLLSSSDDGTCRIWDVARFPQFPPKIYVPKPHEPIAGRNNDPSTSVAQGNYQIFCLAFNANGTVFATGSSDTFARVWSAYKPGTDESQESNHEMDILAGHENDVNYVQFSGCAVAPKFSMFDISKEDNIPKFKNSWFTHDYIVTCSRDGSAIIWIPRSRRSHGKVGRWTRAYHLKVPPPPLPSLPLRGGPRQRILPTPRGVNMIVWSLDNRFVLAAIMDCRICVWNAVDGSLVHSLTGHSESTYVLDVHPFNPRIAMSAGYDGRTIVWDIWEGKPVQIYEIGRFKLVDGKFSPDGTSIILSDDVGQLYILSTGQGESQKDAKYDQFFLGDYRPLALDTNGSVIDQETQLLPYHRNIQDLLCDSGMLPYPEPYQSMYQRRRLGAMGIEWRPPAVRFAVGTDITLDQEYRMLPMVDLDIMLDPLPEFFDAMDWGPEIEVQTDDNDSEYNVTEESSNGGKRQSLSSNPSSDDFECTGEDDSEIEDGLRRSKRKKPKTGTEILSSGRRIKRRDFDECDGDAFRTTKSKKSKNGKRKKHKSSATKSRPRRAAARNAISLLSKITRASTDEEDEYRSEGEFSESESSLGSIEFDNDSSSLDEQNKHFKSKDVQLNPSLDFIPSNKSTESNMNPGQRKPLILKLSVPGSSKIMLPERTGLNCNNNEVHLAGSSSKSPDNIFEALGKKLNSPKNEIGHVEEVEGCKDREIQWGGAKARTSKRLRFGCDFEVENEVPDLQYSRDEMDRIASNSVAGNTEGLNGAMKDEERFGLIACNKSSNTNSIDVNPSPIYFNNRSVIEVEHPGRSMKLKIKTNKVLKDDGSSSRPEINTIAEECRISGFDTFSATPSGQSKVPEDYTDDNMKNGLINSSIYNSKELESQLKTFARLRKNKGKAEDGGEMEESTSNMINHHCNAGVQFSDASNGVVRKTRSVFKPKDFMIDSVSRHPYKERGSSPGSGIIARLRSTRNKCGNFLSSPETKKSPQATRKLSWLMLSTHEEGFRYIPQKEDEVVYLIQGHEEYFSFIHSRDDGPCRSMKRKLRAVEFCRVENLQYSQLPGSGESCCKLSLRFIDPTSDVFDTTFDLTLPEVVNFPDFLVEKSRYDAAIQRNWTFRDKCKVWWKNEGDDEGGWWDGRITGQKEKSSEFPDSPWERYSVQYKDGSNKHQHSPWELFDENIQWEPPHIDEETKDALLFCLAKLEKSGDNPKDHFGVQKLKQVSQNQNFINRFPVPLSLEVIQSRLANNYYRRVEALEHDANVMLENARSYFNKSNTELPFKMKRLTDWFAKTLSSL